MESSKQPKYIKNRAKKSVINTMFLGFLLKNVISVDPPAAFGPLPTQGQINYHREELSAFIHFGMNTYTGVEWGDGKEDENWFVPTNLDTDQWVSTLKNAGFKRIIMIGRHHDGFCLWKSQYTTHQVNASKQFQETSKKLGQSGDVIEEISKSCSKYDMNMGFYLSPWDANSKYYGDEVLYNEYYMNQLQEIIGDPNKKYGNKGKFVEVWMDGAKGTGAADQKYWFLKWFDLIEKLQPGAVVFSPYGSTIRWIGNEAGSAGPTCWSKLNQTRQRNWYDAHGGDEPAYLNKGDEDGDIWSIGECDVSLTSGWFWKEGKVPKSMKELASIYFNSVGRGQPFLLNVPPNKIGQLPEDFVKRVTELGDTIRRTFNTNFASQEGAKATASSYRGNDSQFAPDKAIDDKTETFWTMDDDKTTGWIEIDLGQERKFDIVSFSEHIELGQRIKGWKVEYFKNNEWKLFEEGTTVGAKRLCRQNSVVSSKVRITITGSHAVPVIDRIGVYKAYGDFSLDDNIPDDVTVYSTDKLKYSGTWHDEDEGKWTNTPNSAAWVKFKGTKVWINGIIDPGHGSMDIYIDDIKVARQNMAGPVRKLRQMLWVSEDLDEGEHTLKFVLVDKGMGLHCVYAFDNNGVGMYEINQANYDVPKGGAVMLEIDRIGGQKSASSVTFQTAPDSAVHGRHYVDVTLKLDFREGEKKKFVMVKTINNTETTGNLTFFGEIVSPTSGAVLGFTPSSTVTIYNGPVNPPDFEQYDISKIQFSGDWQQEENDKTTTSAGASASIEFPGTAVFIVGPTDPEYGAFDVYIDNVKVQTVIARSSQRQENVILFRSRSLVNHNLHTIKCVLHDKKMGIQAFKVLNNDGIGMIQMKTLALDVKAGESAKFELERVGGTNGNATVFFETKAGTAAAGKHFVDRHVKIAFADGEKSKIVEVQTIKDSSLGGSVLDFTASISKPTDFSVLGFNLTSRASIHYEKQPTPTTPTEEPTAPYTTIPYSRTPEPPTSSPASEKSKKIVLATSMSVLGLATVCVVIIFILRCKKSSEMSQPLISQADNSYTLSRQI